MKDVVIGGSTVFAANELTGDELDQVSGGLSFLGGYGTAGIGVNVGPFSAGVGIAQGGPNHDWYATGYGGAQPLPGLPGISLDAQAHVAFAYDGGSFDGVVGGPSTVVNLGFGSIAYNDIGFSIGLGVTGVGIVHSEATNLTHNEPAVDPVQPALDALNGPDHSSELSSPPVLNDWSGSFGDHELQQSGSNDAGGHAANDTDHSADLNPTDDHGAQDPNGHGMQDTADHGATQDTSPDHSSSYGNDYGNDGQSNDSQGMNDSSHFGNDFGDSNFGGGSDFGGGGFGGSDFA